MSVVGPAEQLIEHLILRDLAGRNDAVLWPRATEEIPDDPPHLRIAYMPLEWATLAGGELNERLEETLRGWGRTRRQHRNALVFAVPDRAGLNQALTLAERLLAASNWQLLEAVEAAQFEGKSVETLHGRLYGVYRHLYVPSPGEGYFGSVRFERLDLELHPATHNLHAAMLERLAPQLREELSPEEIADAIGLGREDERGVRRILFPMADVARWFFAFMNLPRVRDLEPIRRAVALGIEQGQFALLETEALLELDRAPEHAHGRIIARTHVPLEEIGFENGYLVWPEGLPEV